MPIGITVLLTLNHFAFGRFSCYINIFKLFLIEENIIGTRHVGILFCLPFAVIYIYPLPRRT